MITIRRSESRWHTRRGWLDARHTFSFGEHHDAEWMGFRSLRVLNEDRFQPGSGFPMHPHRDMEILTWILSGALEHRDSLGGGALLHPGAIQRMTAGTGIVHSEINPSAAEPAHLLQIWLLPERRGLAPGYEQRALPEAETRGRLRLAASRDGRDGSVTIRQDADLYVARLAPGESVAHPLRPGRHAWLQVARGIVTLNGLPLAAGDGAAASDETPLEMGAAEPAEVLLFDLA